MKLLMCRTWQFGLDPVDTGAGGRGEAAKALIVRRGDRGW